eukprot:TRINITY_DN5076_c0_g1_i1.p1 TRINITY_DN5076_c0_g1~~TRINITY_DN5076_c0_g1_i1.p1  ORF type:complete len:625 (-),score=138.17 TRINITY_DN5076_c0_g1_i1:36-1910(-)
MEIERVSLRWQDVSYSVNGRDVLKGVRGVAKAGEILAVLGPSGSGKSTLLDILAGRKHSSVKTLVSGKLFANGVEIDSKIMKRIGKYVVQDDLMVGALTVRETLIFAARLRIPEEKNQSLEEVEALVTEVMKELGLYSIRNSSIGTFLRRGISGGEKRRLSIALELLTSPSIILLDEPTSGLDSSNAYNVMLYLRRLAEKGMTVILSIHQPSSSIYSLFDKVLLLSQLGEIEYLGPAKSALQYFTDTCGVDLVEFQKKNYNPAEILLKLVTISAEGAKISLLTSNKEDVQLYVDKFRESDLMKQLLLVPDEVPQNDNENLLHLEHNTIQFESSFPTGFWRQFSMVLWRSCLIVLRDPLQFCAITIVTLIYAVVNGSFFWQLPKDQTGVNDRFGCLWNLVANASFSPLSALIVFILERNIFTKERGSKLYSCSAYFLGRIIPDLPPRLFQGALFSSTAYFMIGFRSGIEHFLKFNLAAAGILSASYAVFLLFSIAGKTFGLAFGLSTGILGLFMPVMGYVLVDIPAWWKWLEYLSFLRNGYEAVAVNEMAGNTFFCTADQYVPTGCDPTSTGDCVCPVVDGTTALEAFGFSPDSYWRNIGFLFMWFAFYLTLSFIGLRLMHKEKR